MPPTRHAVATVVLAALACAPILSSTGTASTAPASVEAPEPVAMDDVSAAVALDGTTILVDPVGDRERYARFGRPDVVVLTSPHPDHLSVDTMIGPLRRDTVVLAPRTVIERLPLMISNNVVAPFEVGTSQEMEGIVFRALSASSDPPEGARVHERERGDIGVVVEVGGASLYF